MSIEAPEERRKRCAELTKQALADIVRVRLFERRLLQKTVAGKSGISRSHLRALLRAASMMPASFFNASWIAVTNICVTPPKRANQQLHEQPP
jgi:hypothetical protein